MMNMMRVFQRIDVGPGCWNWLGYVEATGYGRQHGHRKHWRAHRLVYELLVGPVPEGLVLDHVCGNRRCVNPKHLEPVTVRTNLLRSDRTFATINASKVECMRGHAFTEENTYWTRGGQRLCRTCQREYMREWRKGRL